MAALLGGLVYLQAWRSAELAPGVVPAGDGLAVPLDDAAIYFQYARQALHGEWLRYSPGAELSTGVTSPLYFVLLTVGMGLGLSGPLAAWLLGLAALVLGVVCADRLGRRLFPALPAWWSPLLLLSQGAWVAAHFNAMETGLFLALSLATLDALSAAKAPRAWLLMAALAFTRPEGQVLVAVLGGAWALQALKPWRPLCGVLVLAAAPSALLLALTGGVIPDSVRPKAVLLQGGKDWLELWGQTSDYAMGVIKGAWMGFWGGADAVGVAGNAGARNPIGPQFPPLALLGALLGFFAMAKGPRRLYWSAVLVSLSCLLGLLALDLPVGWHSHRYLAACTPLLLLGMLAGLQALRQDPEPLARAAAAALFSLWVGFGLASWGWHVQRSYLGARDYALANRNAALALKALPPGPIAVADAGLMAYHSGRAIVDLLGITDHRLALAQGQGKGAVLEALIDRLEPPRWAVFHSERADVDLKPWLTLGLLVPMPAPPGSVMNFYAWNWAGIELAPLPVSLPVGSRILGSVNVADLQDESRNSLVARGPHSGQTRLSRLRLWAQGPQVPEGGREVESLTLHRPAGAKAILMRASFDRAGKLAGGGFKAWKGAVVSASPAEVYSEALLPLTDDGDLVTVMFSDNADAPREWAVYRVWFLD